MINTMMKTYTVSFEISVPEGSQNPIDWVPDAVCLFMTDDELAGTWSAVEQTNN
jgi:hypothetical protein